MDQLITYLSGVASVAITGLVKGQLLRLDKRFTAMYKPAQPAIAGALSLVLPIVANTIGIADVPTEALLQAPVTTLATIAALELFKKVRRS